MCVRICKFMFSSAELFMKITSVGNVPDTTRACVSWVPILTGVNLVVECGWVGQCPCIAVWKSRLDTGRSDQHTYMRIYNLNMQITILLQQYSLVLVLEFHHSRRVCVVVSGGFNHRSVPLSRSGVVRSRRLHPLHHIQPWSPTTLASWLLLEKTSRGILTQDSIPCTCLRDCDD